MTDFNYIFEGTCEPTDLRDCDDGMRFLDPCDCKNYYQCTNIFTMTNMTCNPGTLWDFNLGNCNHDRTVDINQNCSQTNSWTRCNTTESRLEVLRELCTGSTTTITPNITAKPPVIQTEPETKIDAGMVAGLILAGVVITLAAIALFVLYSRRKKAREQKLKRRTTAENREYFTGDPAEDPYAIIDDRLVSVANNQSKTNNNNKSNGNANGTLTTTLSYDESVAEYDNSAFREQESGYTSTLPRDEEAPKSPYDFLSTSNKSYERPVSVGTAGTSGVSDAAIGPGPSSVRSSVEKIYVSESAVNVHIGVGSCDVTSDVTNDLSNDISVEEEQLPDYYKLAPE